MKSLARSLTLLLALTAGPAGLGALHPTRGASFGLGSVEGYSRRFGPTAELRINRPALRWEVWPADGYKVTRYSMRVNGDEVAAQYSEDDRALIFMPDAPLQPGRYKVACEVTIENILPMKKEWEFAVSPDAATALAPASPEQTKFLAVLNEFRHKIGLKEFSLEPHLCAAADAHTHYLQKNKRTGHYEQPGEPLFAGAAPCDRLDAFGYLKSSWECVSYGVADPEGSFRALFDAPYHRIPFLQPGGLEVGAAMAGRHATLEFEMTRENQVVMSPWPGQTDVPLAWEGAESPDPLRMHPGAHQGGYPIVFCSFTEQDRKIRLASARLYDSAGQSIPVWIDDPSNDDQLTLAAFVIPKEPLRPGETYFVDVKAKNDNGTDVSRRWSFTTRLYKS